MPKFVANETDEHIGRRIRQRREQRKLSQSDLGQALNISFQQIQKYEFGKNKTATSMLIEIANILDVPITYFVDGLDYTSSLNTGVSDCHCCGKILALFGEP